MFRLSKLALVVCAGAVTAIPTANAADIPPPIPPIVFKGWYLRGDIGYSNQQVDSLFNALYATTLSVDNQFKEFTGAPFLDFGIGYRWNSWLRFDITGEYRSKSEFNGADVYVPAGGPPSLPDTYFGKKSEWLALANMYIDLGTWHGITPFVGGGLGAANVRFGAFSDIGIGVGGDPAIAYAGAHDEWNFAWALYAGLGVEVTDAFTVEVAYRYLDLGDGETGDLIASDGTNTINNPMVFNDITSHDIRLGFRYAFW
jgi:opacity protein-like surface antigen